MQGEPIGWRDAGGEASPRADLAGGWGAVLSDEADRMAARC